MENIIFIVIGVLFKLVGFKKINPFLSPSDKSKGKELQNKFSWVYLAMGLLLIVIGLLGVFKVI